MLGLIRAERRRMSGVGGAAKSLYGCQGTFFDILVGVRESDYRVGAIYGANII